MANWFPRRCSKSIPKLSSNGGSKTREKAQPSWPGWIAPTQFTEAKNETVANTACLHMVSLVLRAPFGGPQRKPKVGPICRHTTSSVPPEGLSCCLVSHRSVPLVEFFAQASPNHCECLESHEVLCSLHLPTAAKQPKCELGAFLDCTS